MKVTTGPVTNDDALKSAEQIEAAMERIFSGELKAGQLPIEPICRLIQFARDTVAREVK